MRAPPSIRRAVARVAVMAFLAVPLAAQAHRAWMVPSGVNFSGDDPWVSVDAAISNDLFYADHNAMNLEQVKAYGPDGSVLPLENANKGRYRSTFDVRLTQPGTTVIVQANDNVGGTYVVDGQTYRIGRRRGPPGAGAEGGPQGASVAARPMAGPQAGGEQGEGGRVRPQQGVADPSQIPANASDIKLIQSSSRNEVFVTRGAPTPVKVTGEGLELSPMGSHPTDLVADEPARFVLEMDGKPAAGVTVHVVAADRRFLSDVPDMTLTTDASGAVTVEWPAAGFYWINAVAEAPGTMKNATRRAAFTATVEVQKP